MQKCTKRGKAKVKKLTIVFMITLICFLGWMRWTCRISDAFIILFLVKLIIIIALKCYWPMVQILFNSSSVTKLSLVLKQYGEMMKSLALFVEANTVLFWERAWLMDMLWIPMVCRWQQSSWSQENTALNQWDKCFQHSYTQKLHLIQRIFALKEFTRMQMKGQLMKTLLS